MKRRSGNKKPGKRRRATRPKVNKAPTARVSADSAEQVDRLKRERDEALGQLAATSEVLRVISNSPGELEPVFRATLEQATRVCDAKFGIVFRYEGGLFHPAAWLNAPPAFVDFISKQGAFAPQPGQLFGRLCQSKTVISFVDRANDENSSPVVRYGGARSSIAVPMLKDDGLVGVLFIYRTEVRPFTKKQIELVKTFAAQAVIAIENTRLLNELRQRTEDLSESLEQQTATSEVLKVISSSASDLQTVFDTMTENAVRLCEAERGYIFRFDGKLLRVVASHNVGPDNLEFVHRNPIAPGRHSISARAALERRTVHVADVQADSEYAYVMRDVNLASTSTPEPQLIRTVLSVPMLKGHELVGTITMNRLEVKPFTDKQVTLVETFAAQAVIAIENTRLLNDLRQRTDDLSEALEQQTATSEVLKVISSSPTNVQPVFDSIAESAVRLCNGQFSFVVRFDGKAMAFASSYGLSAEGLATFQSILPMPASEDTAAGRAISRRAVVEIPDVRTDSALGARSQGLAKTVTYRSIAAVPLLQEGNPIGAIAVARANAGSFPERQMALLQAFADQAVIAIENVRLFDEVQAQKREVTEALEHQTATSEVLNVISRSPTNAQPVFDAIVESAARLCEAVFSVVWRYDGDLLHYAASYNFTPEVHNRLLQTYPKRPDRSLAAGRAILDGTIAQVPDMLADPAYAHEFALAGNWRASVAVPMLRDGRTVGAISVGKAEAVPFSERQIQLLTTFADQAVIATENVRLFDEVQRRTEDLTESLQQQTATSEVLGVISRSSGDLAPVFASILGNATRICEANFGGLFLCEGPGFRSVAQQGPLLDWWKQDPLLDVRRHPGLPLSRVAGSKSVIHVADLAMEVASHADDPRFVALVETAGARTVLGVPMLKDDDLVGAIIIYRSDVRPFSNKQIELVKNFASQAIIAIENARLLNELRKSTADLTQSLENLRTTQDRLVQTQKLASLGQLTAGIAHEIKNPLNFVNNFSGISTELIDELREALKDVSVNEQRRSEITELMSTLRDNLGKIEQHGKRADAIVKNMLLHSREGSGEHRLVDINALVEEGLNLAYHGARAEKQGFNITVKKLFDPSAGEADVFPQDITRVLLNLISNGFYAAIKRNEQANGSDYEPTLTASTRNLGDSIEIRVRDNGTGISEDVKDKIFNPFFTTKPAGEGTGLGLSISHDVIVKQHGGSIEVDTQPGEFTEFRIILPRTAAIVTKPGDGT
jgi:GAF domain-containing protein